MHEIPGLSAEFRERFELREVLGRGASATVYRACQRSLARDVAIKFLHPRAGTGERALKRLADETLALTRLSHPGVVKIFERGEERGIHYIVMELVPDPTMRRLRNEGWAPPPRTVREVGISLLEALAVVHAQGILHRDLKPENLFVDASARVRIADFGLAVIAGVESAHTESGYVLGTPVYLPTEVLFGQDHSERSDIYAVGLILYELLVIQLPFPPESGALLAAKRHPLPRIASRVPGLDPDLAAAIDRAVHFDPAERFARGTDFLRAIRRVGAPSPAAEIVELGRRRPVPALPWVLAGALAGAALSLAWRALRPGIAPSTPPAQSPGAAPASPSAPADPVAVALLTELETLRTRAVRAPDPKRPGKELPEMVDFKHNAPALQGFLDRLALMIADWDQAGRTGPEWIESAFPLTERVHTIVDRASAAQLRTSGILPHMRDIQHLASIHEVGRGPYRRMFALLAGRFAEDLDGARPDPAREKSWADAVRHTERELPADWRSTRTGLFGRMRCQMEAGDRLRSRGTDDLLTDLRRGHTVTQLAVPFYLGTLELAREALQAVSGPATVDAAVRHARYDVASAAKRICEFPSHMVSDSQRREAMHAILAWLDAFPTDLEEELLDALKVLEGPMARAGLEERFAAARRARK